MHLKAIDELIVQLRKVVSEECSIDTKIEVFTAAVDSVKNDYEYELNKLGLYSWNKAVRKFANNSMEYFRKNSNKVDENISLLLKFLNRESDRLRDKDGYNQYCESLDSKL